MKMINENARRDLDNDMLLEMLVKFYRITIKEENGEESLNSPFEKIDNDVMELLKSRKKQIIDYLKFKKENYSELDKIYLLASLIRDYVKKGNELDKKYGIYFSLLDNHDHDDELDVQQWRQDEEFINKFSSQKEGMHLRAEILLHIHRSMNWDLAVEGDFYKCLIERKYINALPTTPTENLYKLQDDFDNELREYHARLMEE